MKINDLRNALPVHPEKRYKLRDTSRIRAIAIHHSATETGGALSFAQYHITKNNWPGIGYHYVILQDGTVQWCYDLNVITYHVGDSNSHAIGICLVGNFIYGKMPTKPQMQALIELCNYLREHLGMEVNEFKAHQEFPGYSWKNCPGFDIDDFRSELSMYIKPQFIKLIDTKGNNYDGVLINGKSAIFIREFAEKNNFKVEWQGQDKPVLLKETSDRTSEVKELKERLIKIRELSTV